MASTGAAGAPPPDPWAVLDELRHGLAAEGQLQADFVETYTPAGFSTGEREGGRISLGLPECLRWDYAEPYAKSFLVCGLDAYAWNGGEAVGRHRRVDARTEPGLDLLLLPLAEVRPRYAATLQGTANAPVDLRLTPKDKDGGIAVATLTVDAKRRRLLALAWEDRDHNRTRFEFSSYRSLADRKTFLPPPAVNWREE